ncbi:hypothetical protein AGMMS49928_19190 [Spirochaetia bacterium]|nr:hypothetical protein AGMMS49928_19190 [Spirochaetia bacterium]
MFPLQRFFSLSAPLLAVVFLVTACSGDNEPPQRYGPKIAGASLIGPNLADEGYFWDGGSAGDSFGIVESAGDLEFSYDDGYGGGFTGTITGDVADDHSLLKCKWGYITIRVDSVSGFWTLTVGSYYVIHWKDLDSSGLVYEGSAYRTGSPYNNGMSTRTKAEAEYTVENGYFNMLGLYNITQ